MQSNLTDLGIKALPPAEGRAAYYWDTTTKGLGLAVSPKGVKTFVVLVASGRREKLGRWPHLKLADARIEAKKTLGAIALGRHRPETKRFDDAKADFLKACGSKNRARTVKDYTRLLEHFPFGRLRLGDITKRDITKKLDRLFDTPSEASHALAAVKTFFQWTVRQGYLQESPCSALGATQASISRSRVLTDTELKAVWVAAERCGQFGRVIQLLILTLQRRGEIAALQSDWISEDAITFPAWIAKNNSEHVLPMSATVSTLVASITPESNDFRRNNSMLLFPAHGNPSKPFSGWSKSKARLDKLSGVTDWTIHDLRRTGSSGMAAVGVPLHVTERILNHISGTVSGVAAVYNRYSFQAEMREALKKWEEQVQLIVRG